MEKTLKGHTNDYLIENNKVGKEHSFKSEFYTVISRNIYVVFTIPINYMLKNNTE